MSNSGDLRLRRGKAGPMGVHQFNVLGSGDKVESVAVNDLQKNVMASRLFEGIAPGDVREILNAARLRHVAAREVIIREAARANHLFLIQSGRIKFYKLTKTGDEIILRWMAPPDIFGVATLFNNPLSYIGSAEALCDCEICMWDNPTIKKLSVMYPQIATNAIRIGIGYISDFALNHFHLANSSAEEKLARALTTVADQIGQSQQEGVEVEVTNEQLSSLANISLFTASRVLSRWNREGTISKKRQKVVLRVPEALIATAEQ